MHACIILGVEIKSRNFFADLESILLINILEDSPSLFTINKQKVTQILREKKIQIILTGV